MTRFLTFGEIMMRMAPPGHLRMSQTLPGSLDVTFAGAEANVAASLAILGAEVSFVTSLPDNPLTDVCLSTLSGLGIGAHVLRGDLGRFGIYFVETGANQRPSRVIYDRDASTISLMHPDSYNWQEICAESDHLHVTGITPALSQAAATATQDAVETAKASGLKVSCDLNYRGKLWNWEPGTDRKDLAARVMKEILPYVDILIANEADCGDVLNIHAGESNVESGSVDVAAYPSVARQVAEQFPNLKLIATTLRQSISASHNNWGAMLLDVTSDDAHFAPKSGAAYAPYEIHNIVDRVGGGDAFAAGLLFALNDDDYPDAESALRFATASSCLAHSILGDFNFSSRDEVDALMHGSGAGRVVR